MPKTFSDTDHRSRLISFRVSQSEYHEIATACRTNGSHTLSEFARWAALRSARSKDCDATDGSKFARLDGTLSMLNRTLVDLMQSLRKSSEEPPVSSGK